MWDVKKASRFIESILLHFPTPAVFLAEEADGTMTTIDGLQRLETIFRYMKPLLKGPSQQYSNPHRFGSSSGLVLNYLTVMDNLNNKDITALPVEKREEFWRSHISVVKLPPNVPPELKYELFARLNQGSMSLNSQELRNCLFRGEYNNLIASLSEKPVFLDMWGKKAPDKRMRHRGLVLRFFALLHRMERYSPPFREFLNLEMSDNQHLSDEDCELFEKEFNLATKWVKRVFGAQVLRLFWVGGTRKPTGSWGSRRLDLIYELEMVCFGKLGQSLDAIWQDLDMTDQDLLIKGLRRATIRVMAEGRFLDSINEGTTLKRKVDLRFDMLNEELRKIVEDPEKAILEAREIDSCLRSSNVCHACDEMLNPDDLVLIKMGDRKVLIHFFCRTQGR